MAENWIGAESDLKFLCDELFKSRGDTIELVLHHGADFKQVWVGNWNMLSHGGSSPKQLWLHVQTGAIETQVRLTRIRWVSEGRFEAEL
jgi:hypothetical protein